MPHKKERRVPSAPPPTPMPPTPGKMQALRDLLREGDTAEKERRWGDALDAYKKADVIHYGDIRLQNKINNVKRRLNLPIEPPPIYATGSDGEESEEESVADALYAALNLATPAKSYQSRMAMIETPSPRRSLQEFTPMSAAQYDNGDGEDYGNANEYSNENVDMRVSTGFECESNMKGKPQPLVDQYSQISTLNSEIKNALEWQVLNCVNNSTEEELRSLRGVGAKRAQKIIDTRSSEPFTDLNSLHRIGMHHNQIDTLAKQFTVIKVAPSPLYKSSTSNTTPAKKPV